MSEKSKAEKLAAARRLLKQFQQKVPAKPQEEYITNCSEAESDVATNNIGKSQTFENSNFSPGSLSESQVIFEDSTNIHNKKADDVHFAVALSSEDVHSNNDAVKDVMTNPFQNIFHQPPIKDTFYENLSTLNENAKIILNPNEFTEIQNDGVAEHNINIANSEIKLVASSFNASNANEDANYKHHEELPNDFSSSVNDIANISLNKSDTKSTLENHMDLLHQEKIKNNDLTQENLRLRTECENLLLKLNSLQKDTDNVTKTKQELQTLQDQLQLHVKTVNVLVGEKNEMITQINKYESIIKTHNAECEELQGRLRASRHKSSNLEKELGQSKQLHNQLERDYKILQDEFEKIKNEHQVRNKQCDDMRDEASELKENLKSLSLKYKNLEHEIKEKTNELSLSQLRIQQLSSGDSSNMDNNWDTLIEERKTYQTKIAEMEQNLNKSKSETTQLTQQYKQYCQQLNTQIQNLAVNLQEKSEENEKLGAREKELVNHVNELEKQLQLVPKVKTSSNMLEESTYKELDDLKVKFDSQEKQCQELNSNLEQKALELQSTIKELNDCKSHINYLEETLETMETDKLDTTKLNAAIESDKVAAARSMAQNADLKLQIEELQKSFIQMSDYKLEITEKLNCEQHLGRELNNQVIKLENELSKLRAILEAKDEEMIRLQNENTNLTKEILQQSQLSDRLRHYEARDNVTDIVQKELQQARDQIANLISRNNELENMVSNTAITEVKIPNRYEEGYNVAKRLIRENSSESSDVMETIPENDTPVSMYESRNDVSKVGLEIVPIIATNEAMEKLQERFTKTMADIAELTEEKQRLEHLVLQLQSETETVGEYIALYQNQRSLLKQRELEKDNQLLKLAHDQDDMKSKLLKLNQLVVQLLQEREQIGNVEQRQNAIELTNEPPTTCDYKRENKESLVPVNTELLNNLPPISQTVDVALNKSETAEKIINLLSELKSSDLIHPYHGELVENFAHHCHCCSGRLLTV